MSRSSKGFADFFPTAPSVLQQKRSKFSQERRTHRSSPVGRSQHSYSTPAPPASSDVEPQGGVAITGLTDGELAAMPRSLTQEDNECANGDIANEVGSASSTSTASSIFSAGQRDINTIHQSGPHKSTSLTPLTNVDSSPRANGISYSPKRSTHDQHPLSTHALKSPSSVHLSESNHVDFELRSSSRRPQARPGKGEIKGFKAVYDPDLDKSLRGKEKKSRQAQFQPFGEEVRSAFPAHILDPFYAH